MMNGQLQQRQVDANMPLTLTMTAMQWEQIKNLLREVAAPWNITHPLLVRLSEEMDKAVAAVPAANEQRPTPA